MKSALSLCLLGCVAGWMPLQAEDYPIGQGVRLPAVPSLLPPENKGINPVSPALDKFAPGDVAGTEVLLPAMPQPMFVGQGPPYPNPGIPNLEPKSSKGISRYKAVLPAGVRLLSLGRPGTSSDSKATAEQLSLITDGERYGDAGYFVELTGGRQWVQVDLGSSRPIHLIWLWRFFQNAVCFYDTVIQISDDPEFKTSFTVYNADHDNSSGLGNGKDPAYYESNLGRAISFPPVSGRYVRLSSREGDETDRNYYIEVSIYGEPAKP